MLQQKMIYSPSCHSKTVWLCLFSGPYNFFFFFERERSLFSFLFWSIHWDSMWSIVVLSYLQNVFFCSRTDKSPIAF